MCIIFLVLVGIISYKVNTTYAVFTDTIMGTKTIEITVKLPNLDKSGVSEPELAEGMIPVYYDESTETWKKASKGNSNKKYQWYDYDNKMWANSVTVSSTNRSKYLSANPGTEIPMDDILTMQVWIPRYKYKVWNYNSNTITTSKEQEIEITFENETESTGEITCEDNIQGSSGDGTSEICKLKATNETCTDDLCNGKTYTHPAFTFGGKEIKGFWIGKFELTGIISSITTKPNLRSLRDQTISSFETNIMKMKSSGNQYGFSTSTDTHMIKNSEWGAVAYLSHSKYGTCTDGTCKAVSKNNSSSYYTGISGGSYNASGSADGTYKYNEINMIDEEILDEGIPITPTVTNDTTYPWTETDGLYKSSNQGQNSTTTNLKFSFTAPTDETYLSFDWSVSSESYDYLYYTITKAGTTLSGTGTSTKIRGTTLGTSESSLTYNSVSKKLAKGEYVLTFTYKKDSSGAKGTDTGYVKNIKIFHSPTVEKTVVPIGEGKDGPSASTTHNIYGVYDMSGGTDEYVMANMVNTGGTTMIPSSSGFTDSTYPDAKYYDKYSYTIRDPIVASSKLGDGFKEIVKSLAKNGTKQYRYGWWGGTVYSPYSQIPWFMRGGRAIVDACIFSTSYEYGSGTYISTRLIITP